MTASKLPVAILCVIFASLLGVFAYVAGSNAVPKKSADKCRSGDASQANCPVHDEETGSFIQVLSAIVPPAASRRSASLPKADFEDSELPFVESEIAMPRDEGQALLEDGSYVQSPFEWSSPLQSESHPLWKPEWHRMLDRGALLAGLCLFIGGIICTAGGIGGGGIYVTVLMFFGELSVHDAIPMSKVVVFAASLPSLILNLSKTITLDESSARSLIDYNCCRVVVPWALIGTLLGVYMNRHVQGEIIVGVLCLVLIFMTVLICRKGYQQHCEETQQAKKLGLAGLPSQRPDGEPSEQPQTTPREKKENAEQDASESTNGISRPSRRNVLAPLDVKLSVAMLLLVICCGTLRFHAVSCFKDKSNDACHHPIASVVSLGMMQRLKNMGVLHIIVRFVLLVPVAFCLMVAAYYCQGCVHFEKDWTWFRVACYSSMAVLTGSLAGLVGIGGGLIFAPFFIEMGIDPHVAVATSSTCVIFTASSTSFQYLFTDRVIVALIISFGVPHLMAAYTGTKLVHFIQDNYGTRKSFITWIVAFGVALSTVLAVHKLIRRDEYVNVR